MKFNVSIRDVNGTALTPTFVEAIYAEQGLGDGATTVRRRLTPGQALDADVTRVSFTIAVDTFADEDLTVGQSGGRWLCDNPASTVTSSGDSLVDLIVTIGCVRFAPTVHIPNETLVKDNPRSALVDPEGGTGDWMYRGAWPNPEMFYHLSEPVFGDPDANEWERFNHSVDLIEPKTRGFLVMLEYGYPVAVGKRDPRLLIAAWMPRTVLASAPQVVVFFCPPTNKPKLYPSDSYPFLGEYPYGLSATAPEYTPIDPKKPIRTDQVHQPYVGLGINYLLVGYKIIYQLLAAKRNALILMPIPAYGSWGPLAAQSAQARFIKEVVRFVYARRLASSRTAPFARFSLNSGRTSVFARDGLFTDELVPEKASITMSAFSAGINAVVSLCVTERFDDKSYASALFSAPAAPFLSDWREIWDIDGVDSNGWGHLVKTLKGWVSTNGHRRLRCYHSEDTYHAGTENGLVESSQIIRKGGKAGGFVEEGTSKDGRITWVHFSNSYLIGDKKGHQKTIPEFGYVDGGHFVGFDAHHFVPAIAFGHAGLFLFP